MKAVLMSIRAEICKTIFHRWTKRLEYRTRFNKDFKGTIYVYESGADGSHKVIGAFDAGYIVRDSADDGISEEDEKFLETLDKKTLEQYEKIVVDKDVLYAIEIKNVRRYREPLTLEEFCIRNANQTVTRPPQSWQYIDINDLEPAFDAVTPEIQQDGTDPTVEFMIKDEGASRPKESKMNDVNQMVVISPCTKIMLKEMKISAAKSGKRETLGGIVDRLVENEYKKCQKQ